MSEVPALSLPRASAAPAPGRAFTVGRVAFVVLVWAAVVVTGFAMVWAYETTPGPRSASPGAWPAATAVAPASGDAWTLVVFAHPRCPCTRATMDVLARVTARAGSRLSARVVFVRDAATSEGWERGDLYEKALRIPGVEVSVDVGGVEARRFGARSSGHALLFEPSPARSLRFSGGLTAMRGHPAESPGADAVRTCLEGGRSPVAAAEVYGCPLSDETPTTCAGSDPCTR